LLGEKEGGRGAPVGSVRKDRVQRKERKETNAKDKGSIHNDRPKREKGGRLGSFLFRKNRGGGKIWGEPTHELEIHAKGSMIGEKNRKKRPELKSKIRRDDGDEQTRTGLKPLVQKVNETETT